MERLSSDRSRDTSSTVVRGKAENVHSVDTRGFGWRKLRAKSDGF